MSARNLELTRAPGLGPREKGAVARAKPRLAPAVPPAPVAAGIQTKIGAANEPGMGLGASRAGANAQSMDGYAPDQPCEQVGGSLIAPFYCSDATKDFLRVNVLRNPGDIQTIIAYGLVDFDPTIGLHPIPLSRSKATTPNAGGKDGAIVVPDGQALIVTDFVAFACEGVMGAVGVLKEVDPCALALQVCFSLLQQNGAQVLPQQALIGGVQGRFCNGTPFLRDSAVFGYPALTQTAKMAVEAAYEVQVSPFPGFPEVVGARMKGYLIEEQLLVAAQDRVRTVPDGVPLNPEGEPM